VRFDDRLSTKTAVKVALVSDSIVNGLNDCVCAQYLQQSCETEIVRCDQARNEEKNSEKTCRNQRCVGGGNGWWCGQFQIERQ
jgi:hypothetical protein